jgi:ATP-dependent Clp protease adaptor protein ClpS
METNIQVKNQPEVVIRMPSMYAVVMYNDHITTMDFVVDILVKIFHKTTFEASNIMMDIHERGQGVAGIYTYDIALTKKVQADQLSAEKGFPLKLVVQEASP